ncbi:hypothetical protein EB061_11225, partial [bacterium]|nr:hypothetical protein [bacterium]
MRKLVEIAQKHERLAVFLAFLAIAAIFLRANPFRGETSAPLDLLVAQDGYEGVRDSLQAPRQALHGGRSDLIDARYPALSAIRAQVREDGSFPLWRFTSGGNPLYFGPLNFLLDPKLFFFLAAPSEGLGLYLGVLVQLALSAFGTFLYLRIFLPAAPALLGGLIYTYSGFNIAWIYILSVQIWLPWMLWANHLFLESGKRREAWVLTGVSVLLIYGLFFSVAAYSFYAVGLQSIIWIWTSRRTESPLPWRRFPLSVAACLAAFPLAISVFAPFYAVIMRQDLSHRLHTGPLPLSA